MIFDAETFSRTVADMRYKLNLYIKTSWYFRNIHTYLQGFRQSVYDHGGKSFLGRKFVKDNDLYFLELRRICFLCFLKTVLLSFKVAKRKISSLR